MIDADIVDELHADLTYRLARMWCMDLTRALSRRGISGEEVDHIICRYDALRDSDEVMMPLPCPHYLSTWRHQLLFHQHQELGMILHVKWQACWKEGVQVSELPFDGARFEELLGRAAECHQRDELDCCEGVLAEAELLMLGRVLP